MKQSHPHSTPVYLIGQVEELTGLSARQLRYYEQRGIVKPGRSGGNQRLYSEAQVELLREVRVYLDQGLNLAGITRLLVKAGRSLPLRAVEPDQEAAGEEGRSASTRQTRIDEYPARHVLTRGAPRSVYPLVNPEELLQRLDKRRPPKDGVLHK